MCASIVGFGSYHCPYDSGPEGEMPLVCLSPRKAAIVVYNKGSADKAFLSRLGKYAPSGSCLQQKLSDVDPTVLKTQIVKSFAKTRARNISAAQ